MGDDEYIKICTNCGDRLFAKAKKCPSCGVKAKDFPLIDRNDQEKIEMAINSVPNPKGGKPAKWVENLDAKSGIWNNSPQKKKEVANERKQEMDKEGIAYCPKCLSTSLSTQKKGGSIIKGLFGGAVLGPVGLLAGGIGRNKVEVYCMKCGNKFKA